MKKMLIILIFSITLLVFIMTAGAMFLGNSDAFSKKTKGESDMLDYKSFFTEYPELLFFLLSDVCATNDYETNNKLSSDLETMYAAALAAIPANYEKLQVAFPVASQALLKLQQNPQQLDGRRAIELERTICSVKNVIIVSKMATREEAYTAFTRIPAVFGEKITKQQFGKICDLMEKYFPGKDVKILLTELILGDLGKISILKDELCNRFGIESRDPDQFIGILMHKYFSDLKKTFPCLKDFSEEELLKLSHANTNFHYGHFAHAECTVRELYNLKQFISVQGIENLYKNMLIQIFDVSGAAAQNGKCALNALVSRSYLEDMLPALEHLHNCIPEQVYYEYLLKRLEICGISNEHNLVLARILCLFRVYDHDTAERFRTALVDLNSDLRFKKDIAIFNAYQASSDPEFPTPTYMPALFVKLLANTNSENQKDSKEKIALRLGFRIVAQAMQCHINGVKISAKYNAINPINFNDLTGLAATSAQLDKLVGSLNNGLAINKKTGSVCLVDDNKMTLEDFFMSTNADL